MRVGLLSTSARGHDAIGNQVAEQVAFFQTRGDTVRLFVHDARQVHPQVEAVCEVVAKASARGAELEFLAACDLVVVHFSQDDPLLQFLPLLVDSKARILLKYYGVTPPALWRGPHAEALERGQRQRGLAWYADHVLVHSRFNLRELTAATGYPREQIVQVPLVVDGGRFRPGLPGPLRNRLGLAAGKRILLYVGRLAGNKRVPMLVEALARLDENVHAVVIGDDGDVYALEAERCRKRAAELGVASRLHLLGQLEEDRLIEAYQGSDVLVIPSLHEGFCVPVVEAFACGLPVVAARSSALPETLGDAGLSFIPDDVGDLSRQLRRVLDPAPRPASSPSPVRRIAIVSFRFGPEVVGGAETSLRTLAQALQHEGQHVEVFTTCTVSESDWRNELPAGNATIDGLSVHRYPVDAHHREGLDIAFAEILTKNGVVPAETESAYLQHSIHSTALVEELVRRREEFDAVVVGPYLFGLTVDVVQSLPERTVLVPCFHDEPLARLRSWPTLYSQVAGVLYHSPEEQAFAQIELGINHPNAAVLGTCLPPVTEGAGSKFEAKRPYVVYCGRYSAQKNLPLLLEWMAESHGDFDLVCMGQGEVALPAAPWLHNLGRVDEATKRQVLDGAAALVQLSTHESLSLVVLEAWAVGTPVIVHRDCAVLVGQVGRTEGGIAVDDLPGFAAALQDLRANPESWTARGARGRAYVEAHYADRAAYVGRVVDVVNRLELPLAEQMRQRGLERARLYDRPAWERAFAAAIEKTLALPARSRRRELRIHPLQSQLCVPAGLKTTLVPLRLSNAGSHPESAEGPGRTRIAYRVIGEASAQIHEGRPADLPELLLPGQSRSAVVAIELPSHPGRFRLEFCAQPGPSTPVSVPLEVSSGTKAEDTSCLGGLLDDVRRILPETQRQQTLPVDYVDVSEGRFAGIKHAVKKKLLNNFKRGYIDVLSRQQSQVNAQLVAAVQQLSECCALLDQAVRGMQGRIDRLERGVKKRRRKSGPLK